MFLITERQPSYVLLAILVFSATCLPRVSAQVSYCGKCYCVKPEITCDVQNAKFTRDADLAQLIPSISDMTSIDLDPLAFNSLYVNCKKLQFFKDQIIRKNLLSTFRNLKKLTITNCDLVEIRSNAFEGLTSLEDINLSINRIRAIPNGLFSGLGSFQSVNFHSNKFLYITEDSFTGLSTKRLILSECSLSEFPYKALSSIKSLKWLTLSDNNIQYVPGTAESFITNLQNLYLDGNPISCTCPNRWLTKLINWQQKSPSPDTKSRIPTCKDPYYLMDIELSKLKPEQLKCESPKITSVDLAVTGSTFAIKCNPESKEDLKWTLARYPDVLSSPHSFPISFTGSSFQHIINKSPQFSDESYRLMVSSPGGSSNLTLTIRWPPKQSPSAPTVISNRDKDLISKVDLDKNPGTPNEAQTDYFSKKQFTLIEMIFAVIGTFMGTLLIFILVCQFVTWYKKRDKKRWATYVHQPYGYSYNCNTHQPPSHHEYDVPQITQPCLPPAPPTTEFFDFKSPRMVYNS